MLERKLDRGLPGLAAFLHRKTGISLDDGRRVVEGSGATAAIVAKPAGAVGAEVDLFARGEILEIVDEFGRPGGGFRQNFVEIAGRRSRGRAELRVKFGRVSDEAFWFGGV
jgi:hypothetical protein